jgi:carbon storage regulator
MASEVGALPLLRRVPTGEAGGAAMLVLSRKCGEQIVLPEQDIVVTVLEVRGEQVRLGISAPDAVRIYRQEIWARIKSLTTPTDSPIESQTH